jgi:flagellar protein FlgJ
MTIVPITTPSAAQTAPQSPEHVQLKQVAQQFEALLLRQMLAEARKADFGSDAFSGQGIATFREMADSRFADIAASTGTLGLGKLIESQVARLLPTTFGSSGGRS